MVHESAAQHCRSGPGRFRFRFIYVVLLLSSLSFLGLGVQPPGADWGSLVRENIGGLAYGAPAVIVPALAIASLTIAVNLTIDVYFGAAGRGAIDVSGSSRSRTYGSPTRLPQWRRNAK